MSYWKCNEAKISEDGLNVTLGFKDSHSCSSMNMTLAAETLKSILTYLAAYEEPERRMFGAQKRLIDYWDNCFQAAKKEVVNE